MGDGKAMDELKRQREQIKARIQALQNREMAAEKKRDMRRKLLAGTYLLRLLKGDLVQLRKKLVEANMLTKRDELLFHTDEQRNAPPLEIKKALHP